MISRSGRVRFAVETLAVDGSWRDGKGGNGDGVRERGAAFPHDRESLQGWQVVQADFKLVASAHWHVIADGQKDWVGLEERWNPRRCRVLGFARLAVITGDDLAVRIQQVDKDRIVAINRRMAPPI